MTAHLHSTGALMPEQDHHWGQQGAALLLAVAMASRQAHVTPMSMRSILLNVLWLVFGGLEAAVAWGVAAVIMAITIIGIPWARAAINIAIYTLLPFGQKAVPRDLYTGRKDTGTGFLGDIGNVIWLVLAGWWLALFHLLAAIVLAITLIALWPIGKMVVLAGDIRQNYQQRW
jgi:uncharacterized membrane protein YccF (DUF307 family)